MIRILLTILIIPILSGCIPNQIFTEYAAEGDYTNNENHFGFFVFDKLAVDSFFENYSPLSSDNAKVKQAFTKLSNTDTIALVTDTFNFDTNTKKPTSSDFELAKKVLAATNKTNGVEYFKGSLNYLFCFECLPDEFKYKWPQGSLEDFEFNVTFFNRLRMKCEVFDKIIYGETGFWDKKIQSVFTNDIFNEITVENAVAIKKCIVSDTAFADPRFKKDKENFVLFLDKTMQKKWRLFLIDKN